MNVKKRRLYIDILILMEQLHSLDRSLCNVGELLTSYGYQRIAIYGMGEAGHILYGMLSENEIKIPYVIDHHVKVDLVSTRQITVEELSDINDIDAIIVTPLVEYDILEKQICENSDIPVIGMADIIKEMLRKNREKRVQV